MEPTGCPDESKSNQLSVYESVGTLFGDNIAERVVVRNQKMHSQMMGL